jgi:hypothetical protein
MYLATLSHMLWVIKRNIYLKFEVDALRNKEVRQKNTFFKKNLSSRGVILIILVLEL